MCIGEVKSRGQGELGKDIANLQAAMRAHGIERGFMNAASPGVISLFLQNEHYPTRDAYLAALADAMTAGIRDHRGRRPRPAARLPRPRAVAPHAVHRPFGRGLREGRGLPCRGAEPRASDVPEDRVRIHICWGNYEGPHVCDIPMAKMFDTLMSAKARYVLFETSNPRHGHEWAVFRDRNTFCE
jgi:5-methyltetrahydropteroyltriglutamate--homocysteine methyltransferase